MESSENSTSLNRTIAMANINSATYNHDAILQKENSFEAKALTPVIVYLVILMTIGIVGNFLVLYVYKFRFRRSTSRVFILSLATFDLITCLFGIPYHILDMTFPYTFIWSEVCKTLSFALTFTILGSIFVLDLIAIDRYRKICTPHEKQLSARGTKIICWVTVGISAFLALPIIFIYGSAEVDTRIPNITGKECYIAEEMADSSIPVVYNVFNVLVFLISVFIVSVLYIKVGMAVRQRKKFSDSRKQDSANATPLGSVRHLPGEDTLSTPLGSLKEKHTLVNQLSDASSIKNAPSPSGSQYNSPRIQRKNKKDTPFKKKLRRMMSDVSSSEYDSGGTLERPGKSKSGESNKHASKRQRRTMRITHMLFIITLIFVISFLPYLIIESMNSLDEEFWTGMDTWELVIYNLLMRTYFINNMVNPVVYWCLDRKFKDEVMKILSKLNKCK